MVKDNAITTTSLASKPKQYIYIAQASDPSECRIGKTNDLDRRLKEYNHMIGKFKGNACRYLFACEVKDMTRLKGDIKRTFAIFRVVSNKEIYFRNTPLFNDYVNFIKSHKLFIKEIFVKTENKKIHNTSRTKMVKNVLEEF